MSFNREPTLGIPKRTILLLGVLGFGLGYLLGSLDFPRWAYLVAPIVMTPLFVYELRRIAAEEDRRRSGDLKLPLGK